MSISGLYYNYERTSKEDIIKYLDQVKVVIEKDGAYHEVDIERFKKNPRANSITWDIKTNDNIIDLEEIKEVEYLVKSSSRFFVKPDIGEIFDQIDPWELPDAICISTLYESLPDTDGNHFVMYCKLMKYK